MPGPRYLTADLATSELVKVPANAFLATKISFINAMAEVCEAVDADVVKLADALGYDDRIGRRFLNAGLGFGGGCLPKDIRAFSARAGELGASAIAPIPARGRQGQHPHAREGSCGRLRTRRRRLPRQEHRRPRRRLQARQRRRPRLACVECRRRNASEGRRRARPRSEGRRERQGEVSRRSPTSQSPRTHAATLIWWFWPRNGSEYLDIDPVSFRSIVRLPRLLDTRNALDHEQWSAAGWDVHALGRGTLMPDLQNHQADASLHR